MANTADIPAWIALFLGLYALAAAVGEFRNPGGWATMLGEIEASRALTFIIGIICLALGAAIYLVSPLRLNDWLSVVISAIGGLCVVEGLVFLAAPDRMLAFARKLLAKTGSIYSGFAALFGAAFIFTALSRLQHSI